MLSQACYWSQKTTSDDNWFWKTREEWTEEIGLNRTEQENARKLLLKCGFLKEELRGVPARLYYQVQWKTIEEYIRSQTVQLAGFVPTSRQVSCQHSITSITSSISPSETKVSPKEIENEGEQIDPQLGFPIPDGWTNDSFIDETGSTVLRITDEYGQKVKMSDIKNRRMVYERTQKAKKTVQNKAKERSSDDWQTTERLVEVIKSVLKKEYGQQPIVGEKEKLAIKQNLVSKYDKEFLKKYGLWFFASETIDKELKFTIFPFTSTSFINKFIAETGNEPDDK